MENDSFQGIAKIKAAVRPKEQEPKGRVSKDSPGARKGSEQEVRSRHLCRAPTFPHT